MLQTSARCMTAGGSRAMDLMCGWVSGNFGVVLVDFLWLLAMCPGLCLPCRTACRVWQRTLACRHVELTLG